MGFHSGPWEAWTGHSKPVKFPGKTKANDRSNSAQASNRLFGSGWIEPQNGLFRDNPTGPHSSRSISIRIRRNKVGYATIMHIKLSAMRSITTSTPALQSAILPVHCVSFLSSLEHIPHDISSLS